jgi:hypothetical protein
LIATRRRNRYQYCYNVISDDKKGNGNEKNLTFTYIIKEKFSNNFQSILFTDIYNIIFSIYSIAGIIEGLGKRGTKNEDDW